MGKERCAERGENTKKIVPANFFFSIFFSHFAKDTLIFFLGIGVKKDPHLFLDVSSPPVATLPEHKAATPPTM